MNNKQASHAQLKKNPSPALQLKGVSKIYTVHHEKPTLIENIFKNRVLEKFTALNNIDLTIYKGEKVGIIGCNGAGKTTLLKIIAGITTPDEGKVITNGRIVSLIDLAAGFNPDLTGEENIFLNGLVIGMSRDEIKEKYQQIIEFADIGKFIDAPLFTYSDGMKLRLGFSIAVHSEPEILLLDEGVVVGDENFQNKIYKKLDEFNNLKKTIFIVSHWLDFLKKNTNKIVWLENNQIIKVGSVKILETYRTYEK